VVERERWCIWLTSADIICLTYELLVQIKLARLIPLCFFFFVYFLVLLVLLLNCIFGFYPLSMLVTSLQLLLGLTCTYLIVHISIRVQTCFLPYALATLPSSPPLHRTPTNTTKVIQSYLLSHVLSPCASLPIPFSSSIPILFTLRSALLSEIAHDQPSRLAKPSSLSLTDRLTHILSCFSFICIRVPGSFVELRINLCCSSPRPLNHE